jgi:hypothetical protein
LKLRIRDLDLANTLDEKLQEYSAHNRALPGIAPIENRQAFVAQLIESIRRIKYVRVIRERRLSEGRADPNNELFDPLRAAMIYQDQGNIDEAFWLVFLYIHFGKSSQTGWRLIRDIYGALGEGPAWTWSLTSTDPKAFSTWLAAIYPTLQRDGVRRRFGNHRKYETLDPNSHANTGVVVDSYVQWVGYDKSHGKLIQRAEEVVGADPNAIFDHLYQSMKSVKRFGRTAKFDYLTMLSKLQLAPIKAPSAYMIGATGPVAGARLLFGGTTSADLSPSQLDQMLIQLDEELEVGMQALEDSLCNWQKSPGRFKPFRG